MARVTQINIFPVKSLGGISVNTSEVTSRGLKYDRRFVLTNPKGVFITQRDNPVLATIAVSILEDRLIFRAPGMKQLEIGLHGQEMSEQITVLVWKSFVDSTTGHEAADKWFSKLVGSEVKLCYMPEESKRSINKNFDEGGEIVSFADGYPLLITNTESLNSLESKIGSVVGMDRFRANVVVEGISPFEEDGWKVVTIGNSRFRVTKPCARCVVTTIDQETGEKLGKEPLRTLSKFRRAGQVFPDAFEALELNENDVLFGTNLVPVEDVSDISVGDELTANN